MKKTKLKQLLESWMKIFALYCPPGIGFVLDPLYPRTCEPFYIFQSNKVKKDSKF